MERTFGRGPVLLQMRRKPFGGHEYGHWQVNGMQTDYRLAVLAGGRAFPGLVRE